MSAEGSEGFLYQGPLRLSSRCRVTEGRTWVATRVVESLQPLSLLICSKQAKYSRQKLDGICIRVNLTSFNLRQLLTLDTFTSKAIVRVSLFLSHICSPNFRQLLPTMTAQEIPRNGHSTDTSKIRDRTRPSALRDEAASVADVAEWVGGCGRE